MTYIDFETVKGAFTETEMSTFDDIIVTGYNESGQKLSVQPVKMTFPFPCIYFALAACASFYPALHPGPTHVLGYLQAQWQPRLDRSYVRAIER